MTRRIYNSLREFLNINNKQNATVISEKTINGVGKSIVPSLSLINYWPREGCVFSASWSQVWLCAMLANETRGSDTASSGRSFGSQWEISGWEWFSCLAIVQERAWGPLCHHLLSLPHWEKTVKIRFLISCSSITKSCPALCNPMDCSTPDSLCPSASPRVCSPS